MVWVFKTDRCRVLGTSKRRRASKFSPATSAGWRMPRPAELRYFRRHHFADKNPNLASHKITKHLANVARRNLPKLSQKTMLVH